MERPPPPTNWNAYRTWHAAHVRRGDTIDVVSRAYRELLQQNIPRRSPSPVRGGAVRSRSVSPISVSSGVSSDESSTSSSEDVPVAQSPSRLLPPRLSSRRRGSPTVRGSRGSRGSRGRGRGGRIATPQRSPPTTSGKLGLLPRDVLNIILREPGVAKSVTGLSSALHAAALPIEIEKHCARHITEAEWDRFVGKHRDVVHNTVIIEQRSVTGMVASETAAPLRIIMSAYDSPRMPIIKKKRRAFFAYRGYIRAFFREVREPGRRVFNWHTLVSMLSRRQECQQTIQLDPIVSYSIKEARITVREQLDLILRPFNASILVGHLLELGSLLEPLRDIQGKTTQVKLLYEYLPGEDIPLQQVDWILMELERQPHVKQNALHKRGRELLDAMNPPYKTISDLVNFFAIIVRLLVYLHVLGIFTAHTLPTIRTIHPNRQADILLQPGVTRENVLIFYKIARRLVEGYRHAIDTGFFSNMIIPLKTTKQTTKTTKKTATKTIEAVRFLPL